MDACTVTMTTTKAVTATFTACPAGLAHVNGNGEASTGVDWPNAYTDLQDALRLYNTCGTFDEIWVARPAIRRARHRQRHLHNPGGRGALRRLPPRKPMRTQRDWAANVTVLSDDLGGDDTTDANGVVTARRPSPASTPTRWR